MWAHNLPEHVQASLQEGRTLSDSDKIEEVIAQYTRSAGKKPKLDPASEKWLAAQMADSSPEESRRWEELTYGKEWAKQNPASDKIRAALDKQKQEWYAQREREDIDYAMNELGRSREQAEEDSRQWARENPHRQQAEVIRDLYGSERDLSDRDREGMIDMMLEEGRTMEEAMSFLADEGMTWEDMTVSMLENFLAEGGA